MELLSTSFFGNHDRQSHRKGLNRVSPWRLRLSRAGVPGNPLERGDRESSPKGANQLSPALQRWEEWKSD